MNLLFRLLELVICWIIAYLLFQLVLRRRKQNKTIKWPIIFTALMIMAGLGALIPDNSTQNTTSISSDKSSNNTGHRKSSAEKSVKKITLILDGSKSNSTPILTANSKRQVQISGTAKNAKKVVIRADNATMTASVNNGHFSKTVFLPKDEPKDTYTVSAGSGANKQTGKVSVKSENYEAEKASIDQAKVASSSTKAASESKSLTSQYQPLENKFNLKTIYSTSNNDLFTDGTDIELNNYKIVDLGADKMDQYHLLLQAPSETDILFLIVTNKAKHLKIGDTVDVYGSLTAKTKVNQTQISTGISESYLDKRVIIVDIDKITVNN